jgi:hypothetical protein
MAKKLISKYITLGRLKVILMSVIFATLLITILTANRTKNIPLLNGYTNAHNYTTNDTALFYLHFKTKYKINNLVIYNLQQQRVDSIVCLADTAMGNTINNYKYGYNYAQCYAYPCNKLTPGVYSIGNVVPLVINATTPSAITVVLPYGNQVATNYVSAHNFYAEPSINKLATDTLSLRMPHFIDDYTRTIIPWLSHKFPHQNINYISDLQLANAPTYYKSKLLILYGVVPFVSPQMRTTLDKYIAQGGNVLLISDDFMSNILNVNKANTTISFEKIDTQQVAISKQNRLYAFSKLYAPAHTTIGSNYPNNVSKAMVTEGYRILTPKHNLFTGVDVNYLSQVKYGALTAPPLQFTNEVATLNTTQINFYKQQLLAYTIQLNSDKKANVGGIIMFQKTATSGRVLHLGSREWILNTHNKNVSQLLYNAVNILQK